MSKKVPKYQLLLEDELEQQCRILKSQLSGSDEWFATLARIEKLMELTNKRSSSVSKETLVNVGANLLGILMIIKHEHVNVIASKALSFVPRLKT